MFPTICEKEQKRPDNCLSNQNKEPSPMWIRERERCVHWNWIAIFSYSASLALSLAVWRGLFRAAEHLMK
jgi:hypothetical protein